MRNMRMKFLIFATLCLFTGLFAAGQAKQFIYYFDAELNPTTKQNAAVIGQGLKTENGIRVGFFLTETRRLLNVCDYQDSTLAVMHGKDIDYYPNGKAQRSSTYKMNVLEGPTEKWDSTGLLTDSIIYINDKMVNKTQFEYNF